MISVCDADDARKRTSVRALDSFLELRVSSNERRGDANEALQVGVATREIVELTRLTGERIEAGRSGEERRERRFLANTSGKDLEERRARLRTVAPVAGVLRKLEARFALREVDAR